MNAKTSLRDEPGCLRFDLSIDRDNPCCVYFYEAYRDEAAFLLHEASPHYSTWEAVTKDMIVEDLPWRTLEPVFPADEDW